MVEAPLSPCNDVSFVPLFIIICRPNGSMSHKSLTLTWTSLEERTDIANILHEVLGSFVLAQSNLQRAPYSRATKWSVILLFKVAFDLQRTYLQPRELSSELQEYLILPGELIHLLSYLCLARDEIAVGSTISLEERKALLRLRAQTLVSGVRALTLLQQRLWGSQDSNGQSRVWVPSSRDIEELRRLQNALASSWADESDEPLCFALSDLCQASVTELISQCESPRTHNVENLCSKHEALELPDFAIGLVS